MKVSFVAVLVVSVLLLELLVEGASIQKRHHLAQRPNEKRAVASKGRHQSRKRGMKKMPMKSHKRATKPKHRRAKNAKRGKTAKKLNHKRAH